MPRRASVPPSEREQALLLAGPWVALPKGQKGALIGAGVGAVAGGAAGNYLNKQADELKKVAETKRTENGLLVNLSNDILFDTDSAILKPDAMNELNRVGDILAKYPEDRIKIEAIPTTSGRR